MFNYITSASPKNSRILDIQRFFGVETDVFHFHFPFFQTTNLCMTNLYDSRTNHAYVYNFLRCNRISLLTCFACSVWLYEWISQSELLVSDFDTRIIADSVMIYFMVSNTDKKHADGACGEQLLTCPNERPYFLLSDVSNPGQLPTPHAHCTANILH